MEWPNQGNHHLGTAISMNSPKESWEVLSQWAEGQWEPTPTSRKQGARADHTLAWGCRTVPKCWRGLLQKGSATFFFTKLDGKDLGLHEPYGFPSAVTVTAATGNIRTTDKTTGPKKLYLSNGQQPCLATVC